MDFNLQDYLRELEQAEDLLQNLELLEDCEDLPEGEMYEDFTIVID